MSEEIKIIELKELDNALDYLWTLIVESRFIKPKKK